MAKIFDRILPLLSKYGYVISQKNVLCGPCGRLLLDNIQDEWNKSFLLSPEVFPFQHNGISNMDNLVKVTEENLEVVQDMSAAVKHMIDTTSPFGFISWAQHRSSTPGTKSCDAESQLFASLAYPMYWTSLQFAYCVPSSKLLYWFNDWQRRRLLWWKRLSSKPSAFSVTKADQASISIQYEFPWGNNAVEHIRTFEWRGSQSWIVCNTSINIGAALFLWDALRSDNGRLVLAFHPKLTPYKATVTTTSASLRPLAQLVNIELRKGRVMTYVNPFPDFPLDVQITQFDEMGIYYTIILNETTHKTGVACIRHRDTAIKEQVHVTDVGKKLSLYLPS
ncbi:DNA polymerase subunit gamma-2, mitochondrial-like isoform X2 [Ornithodoros turicata]|uniref:DNA polymerase subunit gamma-2, mitochondrial-like isoform X2 n=1 Tax=Ornithodoros turicata TaxID=34597 RepID=UPI00313A0362